ncbi:hypothetical protein TWF106_005446 [Orbilia oligospora]|uniref:Uncharacterized protein n=2 Tax=Orbilia oligospora TaxID=2813651 RepID=A0A6G1M2L4_ORBOL|nr:hypothetical protein TWF191_007486 [Orbilia oligospora]KAF3222640.1 hypothetical protein TWF106_005446 [Orbilia oligospora]KAF3243414.1 hypothetical protein TWF192_008321 [Orbilia oligospora]
MMHMSLPQKFPPPVTARRPSISRLRNIITIAAATFFVLVFFLAIKFYLPGEPDFVATENSSTPTTAAVVPKPPQKNLEPTNEEKTIDSSIPNAFNPPTPATERFSINDGDSLILTGVKNITEWHSVGRPPARKDCWSYAARFKPYASPSQEVLDLISNNNKPTNSRAFIVRLSTGHPWKKEFNLHARAVVLEAGLVNYDVFFLVHTDLSSSERKKWIKDHVPAEFRNLTQTFSTKDVKNWLNGTAPFKNIMENNHLALQMFVTNNKQYDFIYSIESDVRLIGRWDQFLTDIDEEYKSHRERQGSDQDMPETPDLVTFEALKRPSDKWLWLDDKCLKDFGGHEDLRTSIGPMWGWSRRLIEKMNEYNANGVDCYYEYFAPTIAYKEDLTTFFYQHPLYCPRKKPSGRHSLKLEELGKNDPRTVQYEKAATGCTYFFVNPHSQPFWDEWYKARKNPDSCWPTALVHPIKGEFFN